jgi:hypothetical protein
MQLSIRSHLSLLIASLILGFSSYPGACPVADKVIKQAVKALSKWQRRKGSTQRACVGRSRDQITRLSDKASG